MAKLKNLSVGQIDAVLSDFCSRVVAEPLFLDLDAESYARTVLERALGEDKSTDNISRILEGQDTSGIEGLKWVDSQSVAELIKGEHPQIIATILVHLDRAQASDILGLLTEQLRNDVLLRIATLEGIQPSALRELNTVLTDLLSGSENINKSSVGGIRTAAEIINFMGSAAETSVLDNLREFDAELAQKIMDEMIVFENLMDIDDRGIQLLLREIQSGHAGHCAERGGTGIARKNIQEYVETGFRHHARGSGSHGSGQGKRGGGPAEADPAGRKTSCGRRPARLWRQERRKLCVTTVPLATGKLPRELPE